MTSISFTRAIEVYDPFPSGYPAWRPAPGTFANISLNTLASVQANSENAGPFANWSGAIYAPDFSTYGAFVTHGSGHLAVGQPLYMGACVFDLDTRMWVMRNMPSSAHTEGEGVNAYGEYGDGTTYPPHTYDGLQYVSPANGGGANGSLLRFFYAGASTMSNSNAVHRFDLSQASLGITRVIDNLAMSGSWKANHPTSAWDASRSCWWVGTAIGYPIKRVAASSYAVTNYSGGPNTNGDGTLIYLPDHDALLHIGVGASSGVWGYHVAQIPASGTTLNFTDVVGKVSGAPPADMRCGGAWVAPLGTIVSYEAAGSARVHKLTPPPVGQLLTGSWQWSSETLTGVGGATPASNVYNNGSWSRMVYAEKAGCMIWADSLTGPVQAWRLTGL